MWEQQREKMCERNSIRVGECVNLSRNISNFYREFQKGTPVQVVGISCRGYDIADEGGNRITECGWEL